MATSNSIQPTAENISKMQNAMMGMDCLVQISEEKIETAAACIMLLLNEPDSVVMRKRIKTLCEVISDQSFEAMNHVNSEAETWGANFIDEQGRAERSRICAAVRGEKENG